MFSFAHVKSLTRLIDGKQTWVFSLWICYKCMLNGDAKETPKKKTQVQK